MDSGQADIELIERFIHGRLSPEEEDDFNHRLTHDREFARKLRLRQTFPEMMIDQGEAVPPQEVVLQHEILPEHEEKRNRPPLLPVVLITVALVLTGLVLYFVFHHPDDRVEPSAGVPVKNTATTVKPAPKPVVKPVVVPPVKPPSDLYGIELKSPVNDTIIYRHEAIEFRWKLQTDTFTNLYVFAESNQKLVWWRGIKSGISGNKVPPMTFQPGKYYWFVGTRKVQQTFHIVKEIAPQ